MQYVRSISGSVSKTWNSINPATLSGAIDVIVVEQEDGSLACSPFHVRFGKFSLLRPFEKKVEFRVNGVKQEYSMKLGEGGEAFFVFETADDVPAALQTSPLITPAMSPQSLPAELDNGSSLREPEYLDLETGGKGFNGSAAIRRAEAGIPILSPERRAQSDLGNITPLSSSPDALLKSSMTDDWPNQIPTSASLIERAASADALPTTLKPFGNTLRASQSTEALSIAPTQTTEEALEKGEERSGRSNSPPPVPTSEAINRAISLSKKFSGSNIPTHVTEKGDLMLDMTGYKSNDEDSLRAEVLARKILAEELEGSYDIGALISADEHGNLWIYSSEQAKEAAMKSAGAVHALLSGSARPQSDAASDPGYHSDGEHSTPSIEGPGDRQRRESDGALDGLVTPPKTPNATTAGDPNRNYAKTLRLTSEQLKALNLKPGVNTMSFSVNKSTCNAFIYLWSFDVPIVISDIDGTITKSDALGHVLNMIGRDWTHVGVAKLYTDIVANGYNIMYLTSRSVGQADTTRAYLNGVVQEGYKLPKGPVILSPDRTYAALRREIYLRKPEVFKMSCLRDILNLFGQKHNPFYAGFGNRFTDALSYRSVNIPSNRIFTINSNAEVSLDLLSLNKYRSSYVSMREIIDHFFPPVGLLVKEGGEEFTDFNYWRDTPLELDDFSASESEDSEEDVEEEGSVHSEDEGSEGSDEDDQVTNLGESFVSQRTLDETGDMDESILESIEGDDIAGEAFRSNDYNDESEEDEDDNAYEEDGEEENEDDKEQESRGEPKASSIDADIGLTSDVVDDLDDRVKSLTLGRDTADGTPVPSATRGSNEHTETRE